MQAARRTRLNSRCETAGKATAGQLVEIAVRYPIANPKDAR